MQAAPAGVQECNEHIGRMVQHLADRGAQEPILFLGQVAALWADHTQAMLTLRSIFLFLDRTYVVPHAAARSLFDLGLQLLRSHLDQHAQVPSSGFQSRMGGWSWLAPCL